VTNERWTRRNQEEIKSVWLKELYIKIGAKEKRNTTKKRNGKWSKEENRGKGKGGEKNKRKKQLNGDLRIIDTAASLMQPTILLPFEKNSLSLSLFCLHT